MPVYVYTVEAIWGDVEPVWKFHADTLHTVIEYRITKCRIVETRSTRSGLSFNKVETVEPMPGRLFEVEVVRKSSQKLGIPETRVVVKSPGSRAVTAAQSAKKSAYGYNDNGGAAPGTALTAVGLLSRYYISKWGPDTAGYSDGVKGLMAGPGPEAGLAGHVLLLLRHAGRALLRGRRVAGLERGAKQPDGTRKGGMRDWLVELQNKKDGANKGSWDPEGGWIGRSCGRVGTTAMCILTLEVYYRYLPLRKRDDKDK